MRLIIFSILLSLFVSLGHTEENVQPLPPEQAFVFENPIIQDQRLILQWHIAPNYYLYKDQIMIKPLKGNEVTLGEMAYPKGTEKHSDLRGVHSVYYGTLVIAVPLKEEGKKNLDVSIRYQGCSAKGFCYSPIQKVFHAKLHSERPMMSSSQFISEQDSIQKILDRKNLSVIVLTFIGLGLLLSFTPCVLPMVPILSGIIIGHRKKHLNVLKTFLLSLMYVLGMAITYAIAGMVVALMGSRIQTELQRPWIIIIFSGIFVLLALSLFGVYKLQLPPRWQHYLTKLSNRQKGGSYIGVFLMGSISSLIVTPCISPPLVGILAYIGQTGDIWLGATALLSLGIGMGFPLLLIGASAGKLLPKAGPWMETVEKTMGVLMLAFAIWILSRILPGPLSLFLWSVLFICVAIGMDIFSKNRKHPLRRGLGAVVFIYGIILMIGAALKNSDPFHPWENWQINSFNVITSEVKTAHFITLRSMKQFDHELLMAKQEKKPVLIDFYAEWCESCVIMERTVFARPEIQDALSEYIFLRADVTHNNDFDQALQKRLGVIAPPTMIFFDAKGHLLSSEQIVGEISASKFLAQLIRINKLRK